MSHNKLAARVAKKWIIASGTLYYVAYYKDLGNIASNGLSEGMYWLFVRSQFGILEKQAEDSGKDLFTSGLTPVVLRYYSETSVLSNGKQSSDHVGPKDIEIWTGSRWEPISHWKRVNQAMSYLIESTPKGSKYHIKDIRQNPLMPISPD
jgi:hypothetical protein